MSRPTAAFSATLEVDLAHEPGTLDLDGTTEGTPSAEHVPKGLQRYGPGSLLGTYIRRWIWRLQEAAGRGRRASGVPLPPRRYRRAMMVCT